jgi:hypothetical protein
MRYCMQAHTNALVVMRIIAHIHAFVLGCVFFGHRGYARVLLRSSPAGKVLAPRSRSFLRALISDRGRNLVSCGIAVARVGHRCWQVFGCALDGERECASSLLRARSQTRLHANAISRKIVIATSRALAKATSRALAIANARERDIARARDRECVRTR